MRQSPSSASSKLAWINHSLVNRMPQLSNTIIASGPPKAQKEDLTQWWCDEVSQRPQESRAELTMEAVFHGSTHWRPFARRTPFTKGWTTKIFLEGSHEHFHEDLRLARVKCDTQDILSAESCRQILTILFHLIKTAYFRILRGRVGYFVLVKI